MGGDAGSMLGNVAGRVLGVLSALPSRGGGFSNLANYMAARQRAMSDPNARAALTPFGAGFYQIGGGMQPGPGRYAPVASPSEFMGPTIPTAAGPSEFMPGAPVWKPNLPALAPEAALAEEAQRRTVADLQSPDLATRARAKQAAKITLLPEEQEALLAEARKFVETAPQGSTASVSPSGVTYSIGSQYALAPGAVKTPAQGEMPLEQLQPQLLPGQVPQQTGRTDAEGRPLYQAVVPPTVPKPDLRPPTLGLPGAPPAVGAPSVPITPSTPEPGKVNLSAPLFRQLEAERGLPAGVLSAIAEKESGGDPQAANPDSSARGLFQITRDTARAWGISADDRYDPVKSAIATADTLAARARQVGIERAIGMHYGGPGAPWEQKVGPSGLSPAQYAADVVRRVPKYFGGGVAYAAEPPPAAAPVAVTPPPPPPAPPPPPPPTAVVQAPVVQPPAPVQVAPATSPAPLVTPDVPLHGYLGPLRRPGGGWSSELNTRFKVGDFWYNTPILVPGQVNVEGLLRGEEPSREQLSIAQGFLTQRLQTGQPVQGFRTGEEADAAEAVHHAYIERAGAPPVIAPATAPSQAVVGYPPPAPAVPAVSTPVTSVVLPPQAGTQLVTPPTAAPVLGPGGMPLETVTQQSQAGETATYKAPGDLAAAQREAIMKQEVERLRGAGTAEDNKVLNSLYNYRTKLAEFKSAFPTPEERAPYVGKPVRKFVAGLAEYVQEPSRKRTDFDAAVAPFSLKAFESGGGASMTENEEALILPNLPHGQEASATRFESKLAKFEDSLEAAIAFRTTISRLPVEQRTPEVLGAVQDQIMAQQQARKAAREEAAAQGAAGTAPPAAAPPPPAAAAPPTAPPTVVVPPPSPPTVWGPEAMAAPPEAAAARVPVRLTHTGQVLMAVGPEGEPRSFLSQLPSVGGAVAGGATGAALGAPFLPPVGPIVGGLIGAGLGGFGGEAAQVGGERLLGAARAEPGTLLERGGRAAARGVVGEALGAPLRLGSWLVTSRAAPVIEAARDLGPVLRQDLPAATKAVETTAGTFHRIGRLLKDPEALATAELTPESQQTLLRAWWGQVATKKPEKIVEAWETFGPEGQAVLAGPQRAAVETVIDTLKTGATPVDWGKLFGLGGGAVGLGTIAGHPGVGAVVGAVPAAVAVGREAARAVPTIASRLVRTPAGAEWIARLPLAGEVAPPWAMGVPLRAAAQAPTALLWPQAAP
jgi:hypothetical protein